MLCKLKGHGRAHDHNKALEFNGARQLLLLYSGYPHPPLLAARYSMDRPALESVPLLRVVSSFEVLRQDNEPSLSQAVVVFSSRSSPLPKKSSSAQEVASEFVVADNVHFKPSTRATWRAKYTWDTLDNSRAGQHDLPFGLDM